MCGSRIIIIIIIPISSLEIVYTTLLVLRIIYERSACRSICRLAHFVVKLGQLIIIIAAVSSIRVSMTIPLSLSLTHYHSLYFSLYVYVVASL